MKPFYSDFIKTNHESKIKVRPIFPDPELGDLPFIFGEKNLNI